MLEPALGPARRGAAERVIDEVVPEGVEWERLVRSYPLPALAVAAAGGFWLGLRHGRALVAALGAFASRQAARGVREALGEELDLDAD
jgi:hypothetical protein